MTTSWVKSLRCKTRAADDVVYSYKQHRHHLISPSARCTKSVQSLNDVVETKIKKPVKDRTSLEKKKQRKPDNGVDQVAGRVQTSGFTRALEPFLPSLTELPEGHQSRNVVEIIFHTSWGPKAFSGRVEMVFKFQNLARTVTRFEEYREFVMSRASESGLGAGCGDHARCVADGNEVMRFHCLGPANGSGSHEPRGGAWTLHAGKSGAMCVYSGSSGAHESAGGGKGRRAMMVCRVIAGRVCKRVSYDSVMKNRVGCDSVSGENNELVVFDSHAVLPCFLIIYKL